MPLDRKASDSEATRRRNSRTRTRSSALLAAGAGRSRSSAPRPWPEGFPGARCGSPRPPRPSSNARSGSSRHGSCARSLALRSVEVWMFRAVGSASRHSHRFIDPLGHDPNARLLSCLRLLDRGQSNSSCVVGIKDENDECGNSSEGRDDLKRERHVEAGLHRHHGSLTENLIRRRVPVW